jgi:hypothetical protein
MSLLLDCTPSYVTMLEAGQRCPSAAFAETLIWQLGLDGSLASKLREHAIAGVGRSAPR